MPRRGYGPPDATAQARMVGTIADKERGRAARLADRWHAWRAARARPADGFAAEPEPRAIGDPARGRELLAGNLMFAGHLVEAPEADLWDLGVAEPAFVAETQSFAWLDDLAAVGGPAARRLAQRWLAGWIARFGRGRGPGWTPALAARRLGRWIDHAAFLAPGLDSAAQAAWLGALAGHAAFVARRWRAAPPGLPRVEAACALVQAGLTLEGLEAHRAPACAALERVCRGEIDAAGGLASRNAEELMEVLSLLTWTAGALRAARRAPGPAHAAAMERIAPALRALRHADGGLPRFHGGGRGVPGRLDAALAAAGARRRMPEGPSMGYARLSAGRTTVVMDAAPPPGGAAAGEAHASTLAVEVTSGRRPVIVSCGAGASFGPGWRRAGRAGAAHSVLLVEGLSSARLGASGGASGKASGGARQARAALESAPRRVPVEMARTPEAQRVEAGQDGYRAEFGLTHARVLSLSADGRRLSGEDFLVALEAEDERRFDAARAAGKLRGVAFQIRFHLHPEAEPALAPSGAEVSVTLRSGEVWVLRPEAEPRTRLTLEPSVYLERGRLRPRATQQIVLSGRAVEYGTRVRWSLAKADDTALAVRDLAEAVDVYE